MQLSSELAQTTNLLVYSKSFSFHQVIYGMVLFNRDLILKTQFY